MSNIFFRFLIVFAFVFVDSFALSVVFATPRQVVPPVRVGICESDLNSTSSLLIEQTIENLQKIFDGSWDVQYIDQSELETAIENHETDFLFLSSAQFTVTERFYGLNALASYRLPGMENTQKVVGASVFTKDSSVTELSELIGKRIAISRHDSFLEILLRNTLRHRGIDPNSVEFVRLDKALLEFPDAIPNTDTIVLPACKYEQERKKNSSAYSDFNPVGTVPDPEFACLTSTSLVPGAVAASLPHTDKALAERIQAALLSQDSTSNGSWGLASDMSTMSRILLEEEVPSFLSQEQWRWDRFFFKHWIYFFTAAAVLVGIFLHGVVLEFLVRRRTQELIERTAEKEAVQAKNRDIQSKFDALEKTAIVGQLSSMVAHELKQPLTAIHNYADGLHRLARKGIDIESDVLLDTVERIDAAGLNAVQIIDHVRSYAKQENRTVESIDLNLLLTEVLASIQGRVIAECVEVRSEIEPTPPVLGNKLELQLLFRNLLKNALDAVKTANHPTIDVRLLSRFDQNTNCKILFEVTDNGPVLSKTQIEALSKPLVTTKKEGLGLGLAIVRRIVESHCGYIQFEPRTEGGLHVSVRLPD